MQPPQLVRPLVHGSARGVDGVSLGHSVEEDASRARKGTGPRVMAVLWDSIIDVCSFSGKSSLAAANRHDMAHPRSRRSSGQPQSEKGTALSFVRHGLDMSEKMHYLC